MGYIQCMGGAPVFDVEGETEVCVLLCAAVCCCVLLCAAVCCCVLLCAAVCCHICR
jgi:hypothetical protein